jgi:hypothetical protein
MLASIERVMVLVLFQGYEEPGKDMERELNEPEVDNDIPPPVFSKLYQPASNSTICIY